MKLLIWLRTSYNLDMQIGLFFGSFNPIHIGHLIIANVIHELSKMEEIWFVVSPLNPHKRNSRSLFHEFDRMDMVALAIEDNPHFKASDIEFSLPKPNYTIDTLTYLKEKFPQHDFKIIIGGDNLNSFKKWKNYKAILENFGLLVYPRPNVQGEAILEHRNIELVEAPILDISASFIRKSIRANQSIRYLVPENVHDYIKRKKLYS